jgi:hypothetical protein
MQSFIDRKVPVFHGFERNRALLYRPGKPVRCNKNDINRSQDIVCTKKAQVLHSLPTGNP